MAEENDVIPDMTSEAKAGMKLSNDIIQLINRSNNCAGVCCIAIISAYDSIKSQTPDNVFKAAQMLYDAIPELKPEVEGAAQ